MITIKRHFADGTSDTVDFKSEKAFRRSPKGKDKNMTAYEVLDFVTKVLLFLVRVFKKK